MRLADFVVEQLCKKEIKNIYTVTGRGILYLTDAVAKCKDISMVCVHHEQAAAMGAMGEAIASENIGACLLSTGCGSTNAITGLLCAWQDDIPCIFISGQNMLNETTRYTGCPVKTFGSQETDIIEIIKTITKYAVMIDDPKKIAYELDKAISIATSGRKGPVWLDIPLDIQNARIEEDTLCRYDIEPIKLQISQTDIELVENCFRESKRPVVLLGSGVKTARATLEVKDFIEKFSLPTVYASSAVDVYGSFYELSIGVVGSLGGSREGNFAVQNADFVLVLGSRLASITVGDEPNQFAREAKIIVVDIDEAEMKKETVNLYHFIHADIKDFIELLNEKLVFRFENKAWIEKCIHWKNTFPLSKEKCNPKDKIDLYHLGGVLTKYLSKKVNIVCDAGYEELIIPSSISLGLGQRCIHSPTQGAMGYALPTAVGAYLATEDETIVISGDGSMMMNLQELQTIVNYHLPIKILVTNNNGYAVIRKRQRDFFRARTIGTDASNGMICADYKKVAECFGITYMSIENNEMLEESIKDVLNFPDAVICEIMCVEEQRYLHTSYGRNSQNKITKRPLEDLSPFLERDTLKQEMIIEIID